MVALATSPERGRNGGCPSPGTLTRAGLSPVGGGDGVRASEAIFASTDKLTLAVRSHPSLAHDNDAKIDSLPAMEEGAARQKAHANHCRHADERAQIAPLSSAFGAAARSCGARSPSGALLRHSPGRTHPPLAQLQFPRFLRPDRAYDPEKWIPVFRKIIRQQKVAGVTRFDLSRVYRAPRRPVVVPAERWPGAARERMANPPAFAYLVQELGQELNVRIAVEAGCHRPRFAFQACLSGKAPSMSEVDEYVTEMGTIVKHNRETQRNCPPWAEWRRRQPWRRLHRYPLCGGAF